jgi:predicted ATPase/DNA-binding SARP family transcriptional activator
VSTEVASRIALAVLGRVRVLDPTGTALVEPAGALSKALLVSLALGASDGVSATRLVDEIWGATPPGSPRSALQTLVSRTRQASAPGLIESTPVGYRLGGGVERDIDRARSLLAEAKATVGADPAVALATCRDALALWGASVSGDDLPPGDIAGELAAESARLEARLRVVAAECRLATGDPAGALDDLDALPTSVSSPASSGGDDVLALRLQALGRAGRRAEALRLFAEHREALADELGIDPSGRILAVHTDLLRDEPGLGPGLSPQHSSPTPASVRVAGLRRSPNRLLGRDSDARAIVESLAGGGVVTILGAGGLGKTRLAHEVGQRMHEADPALSIVVVELGSVRSPADVPAAMAAPLGIRDATVTRLPRGEVPARADVRDRILSALDQVPTLLVVDNCEHLVDAAASWVADIVASAHDVTVLATSRSPLAIAAERVFPLEPLPVAGAAADLFVERARQARPGARLPRDAVERLCLRLDGLPLAIELAAARVRSMPVDEIERRLGNRFALLTTGDRSAPERHRTLTAVIDWSWNLLSPSEQRLLRRLSPLPGGFGAEVATRIVLEAVGGVDAIDGVAPVADDDLDGLVAQSLVSVDDDPLTGGVRYRMLETVREFGLARLDAAGEAGVVRSALGDWALDFSLRALARIDGREQVQTIAAVAAEQDNLVSVLRNSAADGRSDVVVVVFAALGYHWTLRGIHEELAEFGRFAIDALLRRDPAPEHRDAALLGLALAGSLTFFGDRRTGLVAMGILRRLRRDGPANDPFVEMTSKLFAAAIVGRTELMAVLDEGVRSTIAPVRQLSSLVSAQMLENDGDLDASMALSLRGLDLAVESGQVWGEATASGQIAELHMQRGEAAEALSWSKRSRVGLSAVGATPDIDRATWLSGLALAQLGRLGEARAIFERYAGGDAVGATDEKADHPDASDGEDLALVSRAGLADVALAEGRVAEAVAGFDATADALRHGELFSPWREMVAAAALVARVTTGGGERAESGRLANRVRVRLLAGRRLPGLFQDVPILGSCVFALGVWLRAASDDPVRRAQGLRLLALGERAGARQDLAVLLHAPRFAEIVDPTERAALARLRDEAAALAPREALTAAVDLLDDRALRFLAGLG